MARKTTIDVLVIDPDGTVTPRAIGIGEHALPEWQGIVGGYVEVVSGVLDGRPFDLWLNEEGKDKRLRVNASATLLCQLGHVGLDPRDYIAGPAFVTGPPSRNGDATSCTIEWPS